MFGLCPDQAGPSDAPLRHESRIGKAADLGVHRRERRLEESGQIGEGELALRMQEKFGEQFPLQVRTEQGCKTRPRNLHKTRIRLPATGSLAQAVRSSAIRVAATTT